MKEWLWFVFAGEIKRSAHYGEAFGTYEAPVRPYVHASQNPNNPVLVHLTHACSRIAISRPHMTEKILASNYVEKHFRLRWMRHGKKITEDFVFRNYK